jgi:hypothetical protein
MSNNKWVTESNQVRRVWKLDDYEIFQSFIMMGDAEVPPYTFKVEGEWREAYTLEEAKKLCENHKRIIATR